MPLIYLLKDNCAYRVCTKCIVSLKRVKNKKEAWKINDQQANYLEAHTGSREEVKVDSILPFSHLVNMNISLYPTKINSQWIPWPSSLAHIKCPPFFLRKLRAILGSVQFTRGKLKFNVRNALSHLNFVCSIQLCSSTLLIASTELRNIQLSSA